MNTFTRRLAAVAAVGAIVLGGLTVAQAASADVTPGTITLYGPTPNQLVRGPAITSGTLDASPAFNGISVDQGCPVGYRGRSDTLVYQNGVKLGSIATSRNSSVTAYGATGLDGNPIAMDDTYSVPGTNPFVANNSFSGLASPLVSGSFELRVYCSALSTSINFTTDKWFSLTLTANTAANTWSVPVTKKATTVSLTASYTAPSGITLTGTVKDPSAAVATGAVGSITFLDATGSTQVGSGTVSNGVGTYTVTGLTPGNTYTYTAKFVGASDPQYNDSSLSGTASASIPGANQGQTQITVSIPAGVGSLSLSGVTGSVSLGTAALSGGLLKASGTLPAVTVTDTRQVGSPSWSLTGQVSDFTSGSNTMSGSYLGWVPALAGSVNEGTAGATVAPSTTATGGLKVASTLASAPAVTAASPTTTQVGATLNLAAPANTAAGDYTAVLTLTLA
ncbi:carboxypeptidase-like regulatory domain-containing protein [Galbitalea soli]|uniref:Carboxypeptidase regulatory-like domain-containing protein n=1 Tax=Galbitalea soli TaxID=1268042 RepID=A0A7C9TR62_9MICO|nr:carboxypeptidase-like regulatory domain-containing protein [Galbitalea soli]NEM90803.1 carboxypeptidase regulatory-like domain-containing protein [Galbitalea soli]NYJ31521.1 hypothetical protein [Galbitalea soli]